MITLHGIQKEYKNPETDGVRAYIHDLVNHSPKLAYFDNNNEHTLDEHLFLQCDAIPFKYAEQTYDNCKYAFMEHNAARTDTVPENAVIYIDKGIDVMKSALSHIQTTTVPYYANCVVHKGRHLNTRIPVHNVLVFYNSNQKSYSVLLIRHDDKNITTSDYGKTGSELLQLPCNSENSYINRIATGTLQYCGVAAMFVKTDTVMLSFIDNPCCSYISEYDFLKFLLSDKEPITEDVFNSILNMITSSDGQTAMMGMSMIAEYNYPGTPALTMELYRQCAAKWALGDLRKQKKTKIMYNYMRDLRIHGHPCTEEEFRILWDVMKDTILKKQKRMLNKLSRDYPYMKVTLGDFKIDYTGRDYLGDFGMISRYNE